MSSVEPEPLRTCGLCRNSGFIKPTSDPGEESFCGVAIEGSLVPKNGGFDKLGNDKPPKVKAQRPCFVAFANENGEFDGWKFEPR